MARSFNEFLKDGKAGEKYVYHIGLLMFDRQSLDPWSGKYGHNTLHYEALNVWKAYEEGRIELVQERRNNVSIYYAVKRRHRVNRRRDDRSDAYGSERFRQVSRSFSPGRALLGPGAFRVRPPSASAES